jgi:putative Holliday junction resolvase
MAVIVRVLSIFYPYLCSMSRWIAIDVGTKRCGLAVSDAERRIAFPLETVKANEVIPFLKNYTKNEKVSLLIIGKPKQENGRLSSSWNFIEKFSKELQLAFTEIPLVWTDERYTSVIAAKTLHAAGLKQKGNKEKLDKIAACIILQDYLAQNPL